MSGEFIPTDDAFTIYSAIGIERKRFDKHIKPAVDKVFADGGKISDAFEAIAGNKNLTEMEKMYCIFEVSKVCAYRDVKNQIKAKTAGRIPGIMIDQMFGGYENLR